MNRFGLTIIGIVFSLLLPAATLASTEDYTDFGQVTNVNQLRDVSPTDWAYEALRSLSDRYGCIAGFPNNTYRGSQPMTRYEFAAGLNSCLNQIERLIASGENVSSQDVATIERLSRDFEAELATLGGRVDELEARVATIEDNQFSTTAKLQGQALFAFNAGGFSGDEIIDPLANLITDNQPEATFLYRAALDFNASFFGTDQLKVRLDSGSQGLDDNTAGFLEPNFGSTLDFSDSPPVEDVGVSRLFYDFKPGQDLRFVLGGVIVPTDYIDSNSYATTNLDFRNFGTGAINYNRILFPIDGPSAGALAEWNPKGGAFTARALYSSADAGNPNEDVAGFARGVTAFTPLLYPEGGGDRGLFGDFYQGMIELEYSPNEAWAIRLQYSGGEVFDSRFDVVRFNAEWQFLPQVAVFGRYGYGGYDDTAFGDINPNYWSAGFAFPDLFKEGASLGIAAGQPFIASEIGNDTQIDFEAYYNYPINDFISIAPIFQVINNASNQSTNDTIYTGTIRSVFNF